MQATNQSESIIYVTFTATISPIFKFQWLLRPSPSPIGSNLARESKQVAYNFTPYFTGIALLCRPLRAKDLIFAAFSTSLFCAGTI